MKKTELGNGIGKVDKVEQKVNKEEQRVGQGKGRQVKANRG